MSAPQDKVFSQDGKFHKNTVMYSFIVFCISLIVFVVFISSFIIKSEELRLNVEDNKNVYMFRDWKCVRDDKGIVDEPDCSNIDKEDDGDYVNKWVEDYLKHDYNCHIVASGKKGKVPLVKSENGRNISCV